jgi:hypothetical protein
MIVDTMGLIFTMIISLINEFYSLDIVHILGGNIVFLCQTMELVHLTSTSKM